jgi:hypothetical protein
VQPINIAALPHYAEIDDPKISAAAKKYAEATRALTSQRSALRKLENEREQAAELDAEEAEAALAAGKPAPRRRHVADWNKQIDNLEHEVRVAALVERRAYLDLQDTVDAHGDQWCRSLSDKVEKVDGAWRKALEALAVLHRDRVEVHRKAKIAGAAVEPIGTLRLTPAQLHGIDVAHIPDPEARANLKAVVAVEDVLGALGAMQEPDQRIQVGLSAETVRPAFEHARFVQRGLAESKQLALAATAATAPGYDQAQADRGQAVLEAAQHVAPETVRRDKTEARRAELLKENA